MNKEEALAALERTPVPTSSERLRAARFLARTVTNTDQDRLAKIRKAERNSWVRQALDQALQRAGRCSPADAVATPEETPLDTHLYEEIRAQAIEETSAMFLHELRPLVGLLNAAADAEIGHYASSRTKTFVGRVQSFLYAIDRLREASAAPAIQEFDLTDLVGRVAANEAAQGRATLDSLKEETEEVTGLDGDAERIPQQTSIKMMLDRRDSVITTGDPTLVEMAVANALRNAIEAVLEVQEDDRGDVILNWGVTDTDSWVVVLDEGCGLPSGWDRITEPGISTKSKSQGHLGMGLPIAQRSIQSMQGEIRLAPQAGAGVSCEIRWPHGDIVE